MASLTRITTTGANDASAGTVAWESPTNIEADDATYSVSHDYAMAEESNYLTATDFDFSAIPSGSTIDGIEVKVDRYGDYGGTATMPVDLEVTLIVGGVVDGDNKADLVTEWPASATVKTYGAADDLWNVTGWGETPYDYITDPGTNGDFGAAVRVAINGGGENPENECYAYVDYISITVHYTPPSYIPRHGFINHNNPGIV